MVARCRRAAGLRRRPPPSGCELQVTVKRVGDESEAQVALLSTDLVGAIADTCAPRLCPESRGPRRHP